MVLNLWMHCGSLPSYTWHGSHALRQLFHPILNPLKYRWTRTRAILPTMTESRHQHISQVATNFGTPGTGSYCLDYFRNYSITRHSGSLLVLRM